MTSIAAAGLLALACASQSGPEPAAPERGSGEFTEPDMGAGRPVTSKPAPGLETVYFDFDRSAIRSDAEPLLRENANVIRTSDWDTVLVEGHCDERGTEEYNLGLGDRRANAVKDYLMSLGVRGSRLRTVSYGESQPAKPGHDESAWRYNRRVEFSITE